jgi:hypothetical protein
MFDCMHAVTSNDERDKTPCFLAALFEGRVCLSNRQCRERAYVADMIIVAKADRERTAWWDAHMTR